MTDLEAARHTLAQLGFMLLHATTDRERELLERAHDHASNAVARLEGEEWERNAEAELVNIWHGRSMSEW